MIARLRSDTGAGPTIVYVPGIDGTGAFLLETEARLAARFRLITVRYEAGGDDSYEALAASVVEAASPAGDQPLVLLSESFGGAVALQAALDHPERVRALAVVNGFAHYRQRVKIALGRLFGRFLTPELFEVGRRVVVPYGLFGGRRTPELVDAFLALELTQMDDAYRRRMDMIQSLDLRPRLPEIRQPVLLVASEDDRVVDAVSAAKVMAAALPDVELVRLPNAGHLVLPLPEEPWVERMARLVERAGS